MRIASQKDNTGVEERHTVKSAVSLFFCGKMGNGNQYRNKSVQNKQSNGQIT